MNANVAALQYFYDGIISNLVFYRCGINTIMWTQIKKGFLGCLGSCLFGINRAR